MRPFFNKNLVFIVTCSLMFFILTSCNYTTENYNSSDNQTSPSLTSSAQESSSIHSSSISTEVTSSSNVVPETNINEWNLILVNSANKLPENFDVDLGEIGVRKMDSRIVSIVEKMISDAKNDGIDLLLASSYRSVQRQTELFNEQIQIYKNLGYSDDDAYNEAKEWVAVPGTSEHHTGLALDIVTPTYQVLDYGFDTTDAFKWLYKNCAEYGFILRYPKTKSDITGITYEPWHYRYVGTQAAKYIMENDLCLEEYIERLS